MPAPVAHVFLSPHLDDAAWSCGGLVAMLRAAGSNVTVETICAGVPESHVTLPGFCRSPFLTSDSAAAWVLGRRAEDERAMQLLSAEHVWLDELDALFRCPAQYRSPRALTGPIAPSDPLPARIGAAVCAMPEGTLLYAPLGIGGHVDHRIVHEAARGGRAPVVYYEDFPYVLDQEAVEQRLRDVGRDLECIEIDVEAELKRWETAVRAYESQLGTGGDTVCALLRQHLRRRGAESSRLRLWGGQSALALLASVLGDSARATRPEARGTDAAR